VRLSYTIAFTGDASLQGGTTIQKYTRRQSLSRKQVRPTITAVATAVAPLRSRGLTITNQANTVQDTKLKQWYQCSGAFALQRLRTDNLCGLQAPATRWIC